MAVPLYLQNPYLQSQGFYDENGNPQTHDLRLEDLYRPTTLPDLPDVPAHVGGIRDLSEEDRRRLRQRAILQAALAFAAPHGRTGEALAAAALGQDEATQTAIDQHNREADQQFQVSRQRAIEQRQIAHENAQQDADRLAAQNRVEIFHKISTQDPALAAEAEGAAREGDDKRLEALLQAIPRRQWEQLHGYDPQDPYVDERVKAELAAEADARKRKAVLEGLPEELKIKNDAELAMLPQKLALQRQSAIDERAALAGRGLLWDPKAGRDPNTPRWEPKTHVVNGHLQMIDMNKIDPATGKPAMIDLGPVANGGRPIYRQVENSTGHKETWVSVIDPETGQYGPLQPAPMKDTRPNSGNPPPSPGVLDRAKAGWEAFKGAFSGAPKTTTPTAPAPKATGAPATPSRPSPMIDQPAGAPAAGRGQGPAAGKSPLRGKAAAPPSVNSVDAPEAQAQSIEKQIGHPLPPPVRTQLKQRLAAGADPQQELQYILAAKPGG